METNFGDLPNQPYHVEHFNYTEKDAVQIKRFMEEDTYPSFSIPRGSRDGKFVVEIPKLPEAEEFKQLLLKEIPDEIQSCHPLLRRRDIFVRFVSSLDEEQQGGKTIGTNCDILNAREDGKVKYYIRIAMSSLQDVEGDDRVASMVSMIVHEMAETDYYLKSPDAKEDSKDFNNKGYSYTEDEEVANRRAIRVLKRKYPNVELVGINYASDKE